jgi:predicted phage terminase large subunit-like protein
MAHTRLAQKSSLKLRALYDENPPKKGHWSYKLFVQKINPTDKTPVADPSNYVYFGPMNPEDNKDNLAPEYLSVVRNLSGERRRRFYEGQFGDDTANSLFSDSTFDRNRVIGADNLPQFLRVVVAVDPSGASDAEENQSDAIGIVVVALGTDGRAYLLEDLTIKAGPKTWGGIVASAYERHRADRVVAESNFGGEMVRFVVQAAKPGIPFKAVTASRGKVVRAEPISVLVEDNKVRHVGYFPELEDELSAFTTTGYMGDGSPNRADAYVWALSELFPSIAADKTPPKVITPTRPQVLGQGWMAA